MNAKQKLQEANREMFERFEVGDWIDVRFKHTVRTVRAEVSRKEDETGIEVKYTTVSIDGFERHTDWLTLADEATKICSRAERTLARSKRARDLFEAVLLHDHVLYIKTGLDFTVKIVGPKITDEPVTVSYKLYDALRDASFVRHARNGRSDTWREDLELTPRGIAAVLHGIW